MTTAEQIKLYGNTLEEMSNDELIRILLPSTAQIDSVYKAVSTEKLTNHLFGRK